MLGLLAVLFFHPANSVQQTSQPLPQVRGPQAQSTNIETAKAINPRVVAALQAGLCGLRRISR